MDMEQSEKTDRKNMSGKAGEECRENETHNKKGTMERRERTKEETGEKKKSDK